MHNILCSFATQQLLTYVPHLHTHATLPWKNLVVLDLATFS